MVFSKGWERVYKKKMYICNWPDINLISLVMHYTKPSGNKFSVLELGCGSGPNIPFFRKLGVQYYGIDGSPTIVDYLSKKYPKLKNNIVCCDFTKDIPFKKRFDLVIDRSSLTHNSTASIKKCLKNIYKKLKSGGKFIGIDWFSTHHSEFPKGKFLYDDQYTKLGFKDGRFSNVGTVHFSDKQHLLQLFNQFEILTMSHNIQKREIPKDGFILAVWNLVAEKK